MILKLWNFIYSKIYTNEIVVLYSLKYYQSQSSIATIKHAINSNIKHILYFQSQKYIDIFKKFLSLGDKGYFAYINNKCIHRSWVKDNQQVVYPHWAYPYKLKKNEVFIHYCETALEARGKNVYSHVLSNIIEEHKGKDILISVDDKNIISKKGVKKLGFRERENKGADFTRNKVCKSGRPRVMIITMGISRILEPILKAHDVIGIIEAAPRKKKSKNIFSYIARKIHLKIKPLLGNLKMYSSRNNISYYYMKNGSDQNLQNWVKKLNPDVIIVYSMSQLLKENIFTIPKYGTINLHSALLPSYRGPNPDFWMYYDGLSKGGVTVHYIDKGEDTGDIIYQKQYDFPLGMKSPQMLDLAIGKIGVNLLLKALENIENLPRTKQVKESSTKRARNIEKNEHKNLVDFINWDIKKIWHLLRGTELWLDALEQPSGFYRGQRWVVKEFKKCYMADSYNISKIYKENKRYFVACKDGKIFLSLKFSLKSFVLGIID